MADSFHERTDKVFYDNKSDDFEEFAIELHQNKSKANFNSKRYITIGRTYSEIANDVEGVKSDYPNGFDLMQKKTGKQKEKVFEMMEEFAEDLTNRSSTLDRPGPVS